MSDRELLEFAAKAAGIDAHWGDGWQSHMMFRALPRPNSPLVANVEWTPLTDDGDALRLAVKLQMSLDTALGQSLAIPLGGKDCVEQHADDPLAATRRAIVRAAAKIGRQMP